MISNGQHFKDLQTDVSNIKENLTLLTESIAKIAGPLEQVSKALSTVSQRLDYLCSTLNHLIELWQKTVPVKVMILVVLIVALAFGGKEVIALLAKAFL